MLLPSDLDPDIEVAAGGEAPPAHTGPSSKLPNRQKIDFRGVHPSMASVDLICKLHYFVPNRPTYNTHVPQAATTNLRYSTPSPRRDP